MLDHIKSGAGAQAASTTTYSKLILHTAPQPWQLARLMKNAGIKHGDKGKFKLTKVLVEIEETVEGSGEFVNTMRFCFVKTITLIGKKITGDGGTLPEEVKLKDGAFKLKELLPCGYYNVNLGYDSNGSILINQLKSTNFEIEAC